MKKLFSRIALCLVLIVATFATASAQQMPTVPVDSAVRIGKLPNGLTYYIRHNDYPKGQADFYIAQKVGSALEEDNQRGLAHFLEHMCFNGTKNFPGNSLIDWLESVGVKFGQNLNAYTSIDETVYNIANVPTARKTVQDSCLLILHDWADALLLDPEEIDKERGVIHQEWRRSMVGSMRILEKLLPTIYPDQPHYGERLPIGTMEVVDNFPPQALRDYYEAWYRPDQQGIVVVGDIDEDYIEGKIKEIFSDIEMPADAKKRTYFPVGDNTGTIYAIGSDPEMTTGQMMLMFKTEAIPDAMKSSMQYPVMKYMLDMVGTMLSQRLEDLGQKPDAPFAGADAEYGDFFIAKTKDAFNLSGVAKGDDILPVIEAVYRELLRASRSGFTVGEYERAKAEYLSRLEKAYNGRETRKNDEFVQQYVRHFIDNEPIPSIEDEYKMMQQIVPMLPIEAINQMLPELVTADNRVVLVMAPQNDKFKVPTQDEIAAVIAKVDAEDIEPYKDEMKSEPLIPALPAPGTITAETHNAQWDATEFTLSNGVKVVVKPTKFKNNDIRFEAIAKGGTSVIGDDKAASLKFMPMAMTSHGLGDYNSIDLKKYLQGKQAEVDLGFDDYARTISGSTTVKDLPTLMELLYMTFVDYTITPDDFATNQNTYSGILANQEANPQYIFQKELTKALWKSVANHAITSDDIKAADRETVLDIIHSQLKNAADYTFFFVGDIDMATFKPLLEQYIATLPADAANVTNTFEYNLDREMATGKTDITETTKMETPQTWCAIIIDGDMEYTPANRQMSSMVGQVLSNRLLKKIREEMGAVYSIGAYSVMDRTNKYNTLVQISFPMKPEMKQQVLDEINKMLVAMTTEITDDELNPIKEFMVKEAGEDAEDNAAWAGTMAATVLNGVDIFNGKAEVINSITTADLQKFFKELLDKGNIHTVILDPAQ